MKVDQERVQQRRECIKFMIDTRPFSIAFEVGQLARELFISERTVYRDLKQAREEGKDASELSISERI